MKSVSDLTILQGQTGGTAVKAQHVLVTSFNFRVSLPTSSVLMKMLLT